MHRFSLLVPRLEAAWREWIAENDEGRHRFNRLRRENAEHPIEAIGKELRGMMSFLKDAE
jgi:ketol-acid reductoisomerase